MAYYSSNWPHKTSGDKTPSLRFKQKAIARVKAFHHAKDEVLSVYRAFASQKAVLPKDCDDIVSSIQNIQSITRDLNHMLTPTDSLDRLPQSVVPLRYGLIFTLSHLDELIFQLLPLIHFYRGECLELTENTFQLQSEILQKLERLLRAIEEIEPQSKSLLAAKIE